MKGHKSRYRPTPLDVLILTLPVVLLIAGSVFLFIRGRTVQTDTTVEYVLRLSGVSEELVENEESPISIGAPVSNANATVSMGTVQAIVIEPHRTPTVQNGAVVFAEVPHQCDLLVTVRAEARDRGANGLRVGNIRLSAGESGSYYIGDFYAAGAVTVYVEEVIP